MNIDIHADIWRAEKNVRRTSKFPLICSIVGNKPNWVVLHIWPFLLGNKTNTKYVLFIYKHAQSLIKGVRKLTFGKGTVLDYQMCLYFLKEIMRFLFIYLTNFEKNSYYQLLFQQNVPMSTYFSSISFIEHKGRQTKRSKYTV